MSDNVKTYATRNGLGAAERIVPLKARESSADGSDGRPHLCQTQYGIWLVVVDALGNGTSTDLSTADDLEYECRRLGDRLMVGGQGFDISVRDGESAREALGVGRLRAGGSPGPGATIVHGRYVDDISTMEREWLRANTNADETVLAWLEASRSSSFESVIAAGRKGNWHYVMTDRRTFLVSVTEFGESRLLELGQADLVVTPGRLRDSAQSGEVVWESSGRGRDRLRELAALVPLSPRSRRDSMARLLWFHRGDEAAEAAQLTSGLLRTEDSDGEAPPLSRAVARLLTVAARWSDADAEDPELHPVAAESARDILQLPRTHDSARLAAEWYLAWELPRSFGAALMRSLVEQAVDPEALDWCITLHRRVRDAAAGGMGVVELATWDFRLAHHLLSARHPTDAVQVIRGALRSLPDQPLQELAPPRDADLAASETDDVGWIRAALLELLEMALSDSGESSVEATSQLARLQPLVRERLSNLAKVADGELATCAAEALRMLEPGGLEPVAVDSTHRISSIGSSEMDLLRHPASRSGGILAGLVKGIAEQPLPSSVDVHTHMDPATPTNAPGLREAMGDASLALGLAAMPAWLASGERSVGLLAIADPERMLIVGRHHFDPSSEHYLGSAELRAAVGSELANLRFGNARITSSDFWSGFANKSQTAAEIALSLLPVAGPYLPMLSTALSYSSIRKVVPLGMIKSVYQTQDGRAARGMLTKDLSDPLGAVRTATDTASRIGGSSAARAFGAVMSPVAAPVETAVSGQIETLSAMRAIQLTADRAALVLCGDLVSSVRTMFLVSRQYGPELYLAIRSGLPEALGRRGSDGHLILEDPAIRIAALVSFYLSDDYARVRAALTANRDV